MRYEQVLVGIGWLLPCNQSHLELATSVGAFVRGTPSIAGWAFLHPR